MAKRRARPGQVDGLNPDDPGIALLADAARDVDSSRVLLVCSGALPGVGEGATRLVLDAREAKRAGKGAMRYLDWPKLESSKDLAIVWPRAHLGKDFTQQTIAVALMCLRTGGKLSCAVRKQKGADSIADFMADTFGNVRVDARAKGYRLLVSEREHEDVERPEILDRTYSFSDDRLPGMDILSAPGTFSRKGLDIGTACLIDHVARLDLSPARVVDLGAGVGPLALWAAARWSEAQIVAVESNAVSAAMLRRNVHAADLQSRVFAMEHDGLPSTVAAVRPFVGTTDLTLTNPPTHADAGALDDLLGPLASWQRKGSRTLAVVSRPQMVTAALHRAGARVHAVAYDRFTVLDATW